MDLGKFVFISVDERATFFVYSPYLSFHSSPNSDLDMCLQVPFGTTITSEDMGKLAEKLSSLGMLEVDTSRLTARIPVVKFNCRVEIGGSESIIECDISMQNPLACINTSLLQSYSTISPKVRILAAIVKRWAKRRGINDPSSVSSPLKIPADKF